MITASALSNFSFVSYNFFYLILCILGCLGVSGALKCCCHTDAESLNALCSSASFTFLILLLLCPSAFFSLLLYLLFIVRLLLVFLFTASAFSSSDDSLVSSSNCQNNDIHSLGYFCIMH